jgi:hypothetical protein
LVRHHEGRVELKSWGAVMLATGAATLAATAVVALAQGGEVKVGSSVTIKHDPPREFSGKVKADNPNCVEGRKVVLRRYFVATSGSRGLEGEPGGGEKVGSDTTDENGKWKIKSGSSGSGVANFYAEVKRAEQGTAGTIYVCKKARSETIVP